MSIESECLSCVEQICSAQAATSGRSNVSLNRDSVDMCSFPPAAAAAAERSRSFQIKWSLLTEKEFLFGARKLIFSDMHGFRFLTEALAETAIF